MIEVSEVAAEEDSAVEKGRVVERYRRERRLSGSFWWQRRGGSEVGLVGQ